MPKLLSRRTPTAAVLPSPALTVRPIGSRLQGARLLPLWALAWLLLLGLSSLSPPVDNAEQLVWVRSLEWGYYKHPPLPTALLWPLVQLFGLHDWVTYLAAGGVTVTALLLAHRLVRQLCGPAVARLALLGTLCIGYYTQRLSYFNHDTLLLLCHSAAAWCTWRALVWRERGAWPLLGLVLGLGALAKYQVSLVAASALACWLLQAGWRDAQHRRGLLQAAGVALLVFSPHAVWLVTHDFLPLQYLRGNGMAAAMSLGRCSVGALRWVGDQFSQLAGPLLLGAGLLALAGRGGRAAPTPSAGPGAAIAVDPALARRFLACWGLLPLVLMPGIALVLRGKLHMNWGTAFMGFTCAALMAQTGLARWRAVRWPHALAGFALVQAALATYLLSTSPGSAPVLNQNRSRNFASQHVADQIGAPARLVLGGPIQVIAGPQRLASVLALRLPERPLVMVDGRYDISPWLPRDMHRICGILWVGGAGEYPPWHAERHALGEGLWWAVEPLNDDQDCGAPPPPH